MHRDASVEIEESDVYALLQVPNIGALACDSCMLAAIAKMKLTESRLWELSAPGATFIEGAGSQWNEYDEYCGLNHHVRLDLGGGEQVVRLQVTERASVATMVLQEMFYEQLHGAMSLLRAQGYSAHRSEHSCSDWSVRVWAEDESGDVVWEAVDSPNLASVVESIAAHKHSCRTATSGYVDPPGEVSAGVFVDTTDIQAVGDAVCHQRLTNTLLVEAARAKLESGPTANRTHRSAYEVVAGTESEWELDD